MKEEATIYLYADLIKEELKTNEARSITNDRAESLAKEAVRLASCLDLVVSKSEEPYVF